MAAGTSPAAITSASIGGRVRTERGARGWTLDALAQRSGVSRRMLINIEHGSTNTSIATLLRLADALGISLSQLVEVPSSSALAVRRVDRHHVFWHGEHGGRAVLVASTHGRDGIELWDWSLGREDRYPSAPHRAGTQELLHVLDGTVCLAVDDESVELQAGDAVSFTGDRSHTYANPGTGAARFSLAVFEPGVHQ